MQLTDRGFFAASGRPLGRGKFFVITHDRRAETRVIRERFRDITIFVVWAERHLAKIEDR